MIYLDNAATSWPKPPAVLKAMTEALELAGGNPGRSGHRLSIAAARVIYNTREEIARFFGISDPLRVIFTGNATHALNLAIKGILKPGDRVVTTSMEHNSVMRPLRYLEKQGVCLDIVRCAADGSLNIKDIAAAIDLKTKLVVITHASNIVGTILPVAEVCAAAHNTGALVLVDAAQTAGAIPIDMKTMGIDLLAFTGHKELQGPTGIGGLVISDDFDILQMEPLLCGGTGSRSEFEEQPDDLPDKYESGTGNLVGIAGLEAGLKWITARGINEIRTYHQKLTRHLIDGLSAITGVKIYGTLSPENSVSIVSFTIEGKRVSEIGLRLDEEYGVLARVGLHCAPAAHKTIGSFPEGTVRFAPGIFTTADDIEEVIQAISRIVRE
ncbi:MAG: aminotransferase class V-fold PLP-dependent enzyme [Dehalococcoidales bacterium]|nr:aminotransferase class V-fold PLP-dependent enzyme [Dehalococcoidales bacterium]